MDYLPIFLDIRNRNCLVVGGGEVAARKIALLLRAGARITVISPQLCAELETQCRTRLRRRATTREKLSGMRKIFISIIWRMQILSLPLLTIPRPTAKFQKPPNSAIFPSM